MTGYFVSFEGPDGAGKRAERSMMFIEMRGASKQKHRSSCFFLRSGVHVEEMIWSFI